VADDPLAPGVSGGGVLGGCGLHKTFDIVWHRRWIRTSTVERGCFKGKGSFLHVDRASLDMMHVYLVAANFVQAHASRQPERGIHHLNYIIMGV
jgi:hypothetical protein